MTKVGNNAFFWEITEGWLHIPPCPVGKVSSGTGPYVLKNPMICKCIGEFYFKNKIVLENIIYLMMEL